MADLKNSIFFSLLKTKHPELFEMLGRSGGQNLSLLVPSNVSMRIAKIKKFNSEFFESHILIQAHQTTDGTVYTINSRAVNFDFQNKVIVTGFGFFNAGVSVRITDETEFYTESLTSFHVMTISQPLTVCTLELPKPLFDSNPTSSAAFVKCLEEATCLRPFLNRFEEQTVAFRKSYVLAKGFLDFAGSRVSEIVNTGVDNIVKCNELKDNLAGISQDPLNPIYIQLHRAVFCTVMDKLNLKLLLEMKKLFHKEQSEFYRSVSVLADKDKRGLLLTGSSFSDPPHGFPSRRLIDQFSGLAQFNCPMDFVDGLEGAVEVIFKETEESGVVITADDLLPLIAFVISYAKPLWNSLVVQIEYCKTFYMEPGTRGPDRASYGLGNSRSSQSHYYLSTVEACIENVVQVVRSSFPRQQSVSNDVVFEMVDASVEPKIPKRTFGVPLDGPRPLRRSNTMPIRTHSSLRTGSSEVLLTDSKPKVNFTSRKDPFARAHIQKGYKPAPRIISMAASPPVRGRGFLRDLKGSVAFYRKN